MIHRRALITGLLASVAAPALMPAVALVRSEMTGATTVYYAPYVTWTACGGFLGMPTAFRWYWDGKNVRSDIVPWDDLYQPR